MSSYYEKILATGEVKCIDEEIPFEIPQGWEWCRLRDVIQLLSGRDLEPSMYNSSQKGIPYITGASNFNNENLIVNRWTQTPVTVSEEGDLLITCKGTIGTMAFNNIGSIHIARQIMAIHSKDVDLHYLKLYFELNIGTLESQANSMIPGISREVVLNSLVPIPPLQEQIKIVEKNNSLIPLVSKYSFAQGKLNLLNNVIKNKLEKTILQEAIKGKLVPQLAEEGTAQELLEQIKTEKQKLVKEGKLKKSALNDSVIFHGDDNKYYEQIGKKCLDITDEIPFVIPETWQWVRIRDIFQLNPKNEAEDEKLVAFIPMEKISAGYKSDFTFDTAKWGTIKKGFTHFANGDVAFAKITPCFQNRKSAIFHDLPNGIGAGTTELKVLRPYGNTIDRWYLLYFLESPYFIDEATFKGTANQQRIVVGYLEDKLFPLPTQKEQQRIVAQIENLFEQLH